MPDYRDLLSALRLGFPQPVSDPVHDAYFVYSISRALDQIDSLKSQAPLLGSPVEPRWEAARAERLADTGQPLEGVIPRLVDTLTGMFQWSHPRCQVNVVPGPTIASIIGVLLPSTYNPNLCSEEGGLRPAETEVRVAAMAADLVGFDAARARGVFTFGGTGALLYGLKVGLEKACPGSARAGLRHEVVVLASEQCHYACLTAAAWLGIGQDRLLRAPSLEDNSIDLAALEHAARDAIARGQRLAGLVATVGTTDAFGLDDVAGVVALRDRLVVELGLDYRPHVHADAVIGWAWSVFNDYDFAVNPLGFRGRTVRALALARHRISQLAAADSIGIDFHKTAWCPYVSSLVLFRNGGDLDRIARGRAQMPYLYRTGEYHPGIYTLETTRSGAGPLAALASLLYLGKNGLRVLLGHAVELAEHLREAIEAHPELSVLNRDNVGPVTLFRAYPAGSDTFSIKQRELHDPSYHAALVAHNEYNRQVFEQIHAEALAGRGVALSLTDYCPGGSTGEPITALKSYVLSPFAEPEHMRSIVEHVLAARVVVDARGTAGCG